LLFRGKAGSPRGPAGLWEELALGLGAQAWQLLGAGRLWSLGWRGGGGWPVGGVCRGAHSSLPVALRPCQVVVEPGPGAKVPGNWIAI
jgi:hypothetical protein